MSKFKRVLSWGVLHVWGLTRASIFVAAVRKVLTGVGLNNSNYAGHSFRIAMMVAQVGTQDSLTKTLGPRPVAELGIIICCMRGHLGTYTVECLCARVLV